MEEGENLNNPLTKLWHHTLLWRVFFFFFLKYSCFSVYLINELSNHAIPGAVLELLSIFAIRSLIYLIFEAQILGKCIQDINGKSFISLWLPKYVLCHHHKRFFLKQNNILTDTWNKFFSLLLLPKVCFLSYFWTTWHSFWDTYNLLRQKLEAMQDTMRHPEQPPALQHLNIAHGLGFSTVLEKRQRLQRTV